MNEVLRKVAVYLGLAEMDDDEWHQWQCSMGRHEWGLTQREVTRVPIMKCTNRKAHEKVGWEYIPISGPRWRKCNHCPVMEFVE